MAAGRIDLALRKQHGRQQMTEHGLAGLAGEALFAKLAGLVRLAPIESRRGTTNDVLGGVFAHVVRIVRVRA